MPIMDRNDAVEVSDRIDKIFSSKSVSERAADIRGLFVEALDFDPAFGSVTLTGAPSSAILPDSAERVAQFDGVHVLFVALDTPDTDRVRKGDATAAARLIADQLSDDILLIFTNTSASQLHFIYPAFKGSRPTLRRMIVERDLPRRTAVQQISNIYWNFQDSRSIRDALDKAFDVEPVTKEFFAEYKRIFDAAEMSVSGFGDGEDEREARRLFTQTLFNRLMFVYFLSRKGWLSFKGDKDYLNALYRDYKVNHTDDPNFYRDRLRLLFFAGLNNYRSEDLTSEDETRRLIGEPPFLNGGLFEETDLDRRWEVTVPDSAIEQMLDGLFDKFNFTVMESTPFDIEVAVDPEMLGKVFEELVTGRHDSGAYYTPRPVVSFMCREALKGYLEGRETSLSAEAIARFVDERDASGIPLSAARGVGEALDEVTVVDPACGSGAYLLGMMQELVELQTALYDVGVDARGLYELKLHIIERNLYGVDIDEFAVNIAMLRMWLSLVIEYEGDNPEPLPNLDFKVVCGDSLLGPDPSSGVEVQGTLGQDTEQMKRLGQLKAEYMRASHGPDKKRLKNDIEDIEKQVKEALGGAGVADDVVDWRVEFAEIFATEGGFDVAIANPPYVRQEKIGESKPALQKLYSDSSVGRSDLYCYFYARALQILRPRGMHVFVCSNSWLDVGYGAKLQQYLLDNTHIQAIYESTVERQFSTADINTIISVISKANAIADGDLTRFVSLRGEFEVALSDADQGREIEKTRASLRVDGANHRNRYVGDKWGGKYLRAPDIYHHIMDNYGDKLVRLEDIATVRFGIKTGANAFFYLTPERIVEFGIEPEFCRPVMTSPQESRSIAVVPTTLPKRLFMCHQDKSELADTGALAYIEWG